MATVAARAAEAADPGTPADVLAALAADRAVKVRIALARNPAVSTEILRALVDDSRWEVRFTAAENRSQDAVRVALAATHVDTREIAAQRCDLAPAEIETILRDPARQVRQQLADATDDPEILSRLARDEHPYVRASAVLNDHMSTADTEMLAEDRIARVRGAAAASRRLRPATLTKLASDRSVDVRWNVLAHNPERLDLAALIAEDDDETNSGQARSQLEDPRTFTEHLGDVDLIR
ncbi:hypothetical protein ACIRON_27450 [Nocardioides sp. NPDC101246]|uniref:hypothetical protein n=1 Tax=Nocardioides sp. NPDC101246 TaxID=3364336 RepID=UPI003820E2C5